MNIGGPMNTPNPMMGGNNNGGGAISLVKGEKVSLTKIALDKGITTPLNNLTVGLGWDVNNFTGAAFDLDASCFMLGQNDRVPNNSYFIFYGQLQAANGAVIHTGDNLTGEGDGDDEQLKVSLAKVPAEIQKLVFAVTIYDCKTRGQNFGQVKNAFIRVVDDTTGMELVRFDLTEQFSTQTALIVGEIYRYNNEWKFNAVGAGYPDDLATFCNKYGVQI
jgi:tellurium resistance protein TerD